MASGTLERCSLHAWIPDFTVQGRWQTVWVALCRWDACWCQRCGSSGPWWRWGYGMGRCMLWRCILLMAFWMHRDTVKKSWGSLLCHSSTTITSCCSMKMYGPMLQGSEHSSWQLKTSQFLHGQHLTGHVTHWACLGYDTYTIRIWQRVPVPANIQQLRTAIDEEWAIIPQATINNLINSMWRRCEAHGGRTRYWPVLWPPKKAKLLISECPFPLWGGWIISAEEKCSLTQI